MNKEEQRLKDIASIDITKFGWIAKLARKWNISHSTVIRYIYVHFPEIIEKCYKKKSKKKLCRICLHRFSIINFKRHNCEKYVKKEKNRRKRIRRKLQRNFIKKIRKKIDKKDQEKKLTKRLLRKIEKQKMFCENQIYYLKQNKHISDKKITKAAQNSRTMTEAAAKCKINFLTYRKRAIKLNVYNPNLLGKNLEKKHFFSRTLNYFLKVLAGEIRNGYSISKVKNKLFKYKIKKYECEICKISSWMGKEIKLQLHHKDGNCYNNIFINLQILCPNCHSQTENFNGRNRKKKRKPR